MEDTADATDLNENCDTNYINNLKENDPAENEKQTYRSVISVNILNNANNNFVQTVSTATNTLKSDFLNSTLKSPNLVKKNILNGAINNTKNIESAIITDLNKNPNTNGDNQNNIDRSITNSPVKSTDAKKPLKGILKNSSSSPARSITFNVETESSDDHITVDEIQSRLAESQSKISQLQNSLPTKLNSATIESLKVKYSPVKNYLRTTSSPFKTKLEYKPENDVLKIQETKLPDDSPESVPSLSNGSTDENRDSPKIDSSSIDDNLNIDSASETDKKTDTDDSSKKGTSTESLEDELPDKIDAYALFIRELTMSEDGKKKKRSNSFRKIFPAKLFGLRDKKGESPKNDKATTSAEKPACDNATYFNRNSRERHTFSNFPPCKNYNTPKDRLSLEHGTQNYAPGWGGKTNLTYFKEDEYSLPVDACIRNDKVYSNKKELGNSGEDYVCMNSRPTSTGKQTVENVASYVNIDNNVKSDLDIEPIRRKSNSLSTGDKFNKNHDTSHDRHELIEPTKAVIPLNTERALPNPYQRNNQNVIPESIILEPMYINVNSKRQDWEKFNSLESTKEPNNNANDKFGKQGNDLVDYEKFEKTVDKVINVPNCDAKLSNSPYETIFGNIPVKNNSPHLDHRPNFPQHQGRISTRSLSPEQRYKLDCVKTSPVKSRNETDIIPTSSRRNPSPERKSFNNDCCLKTSPKKNRDVDNSKSAIVKAKPNKKKNKNEADEYFHQNLEIPIDYPEINLNNASKHSPKKQLYENFPYLDTRQNRIEDPVEKDTTSTTATKDLNSLPGPIKLNKPINEIQNSPKLEAPNLHKPTNDIQNSPKVETLYLNKPTNDIQSSPKVETTSLYQNSSPGPVKNNIITKEIMSPQTLSRISSSMTISNNANSSIVNYPKKLQINEEQPVARSPSVELEVKHNSRTQQPSPSRISPAINYSRTSLDSCPRGSPVSPQRSRHNSNPSPINYNTRPIQVIQNQGRGVSPTQSPQKLRNLQNVEAFYWKKISEMKEKEQMSHLYFNPQSQHPQMNQSLYNNVSDTRPSRSRETTPQPQQRGRRSLSLPRNIKPERPGNENYANQVYSFEEPMRPYSNNPQYYDRNFNTPGYGYTTGQQQPILPQNQLPPSNFNRRTPQRSTISAINYNPKNKPSPQGQLTDAIYENYVPGVQFRHQAQPANKADQSYAPIFKRGSLQYRGNMQDDGQPGSGQKKVSFLSASQGASPMNPQSLSPAWPTKNGYVQSPPTRRNNRSESVGSDNVFISTPPGIPRGNTQVFFNTNQEFMTPVYGRTQPQQDGQIYGQTVQNPHDANEIYGQTIYGKTAQRPADMSPAIYGQTASPIYGKASSNQAIYGRTAQPKQVIVRNKVCDIYGQIHDNTQDDGSKNQIYGQIKKSGIIYGELKGSLNSQPNRLQQRALPPPPQPYTSPTVPRSSQYVYHPGTSPQMNQLSQQIPSESESGSEAGEIQRIMQNSQLIDVKSQGVPEEEWNADGKSGRGHSGNESGGVNSDGELRGSRSGRSARREDPRRHTLSGDQHLYQPGGAPGGILRTMDLESSLPRGYPPPSAMLFDDDPGIMSEVETSSTGFRRGGKQRSSLPVVRTPSKTLERPLGLVFLQYRNETKRALLPNEITSIDTVKALFVRSFPKQLTMEYLDSPLVKIYIHDSSKDMFYELEDLRSHLRDIRDRSVLRLFESTDISGGLPVAGQGISGGVGHFEDQSYFSEPEFDSEYQHQHIHKSKSSAKAAPPYYLASTTSTLPRGGPLLRTYSPAIGGAPVPADRIKSLPGQTDRMRTDGYMSSPERSTRGQYEDPYYSQFAPRSGSITPVIDEEASDTELLDESYSLYGAKIPSGGPRAVPAPRSQFPTPAAVPYDTTRIRVEHMERQLANLTGLVQKALTQAPPTPRDFLIPPGRDNFRSGDEFDKNSSSSSTSLPDDSYLRSDTVKTPKLGKSGCHKSVSFEKSVSFSDEPPDMNSPKQHSPQHTADTKPPKPAIKSSTLPRTSSQERDRLKPAPPPKPAALAAVQYDSSRHLYRDLQLTPEMYNQLRGLQKKAKDLRAEVRNLRRMSQAQAHSVRETIRDTFIKIRTMLLVGGEQAWQAGMDQERVRLSREEDLYKQEMIRLEKDLSDLESTVEELRGNVINRKTRVNMSDVENMALILSKSSKTVADLKVRFPSLQEGLKGMLTSEMEKVVREEKFLKEEPERLESALRRCKKLTGTLVTLKRLASVQEQRLPCPGNPTGDGRLSPSADETPPITPTSAQHGKPTSIIPSSRPNVGPGGIGGDSIDSESSQRPENALDALLDELQTFSRPHNTSAPQSQHVPPSQQNTQHAPTMGEIGRKGSMDSHALTVSTGSGTGSLRRLHSYPSGSDTDNSPPIQPAPRANVGVKPPLPERNAELLQALAGRRVPPPPPPRTSSRSPLASPTSPGIPPRNTPSTLQHIQNVQNMAAAQNNAETQSQFEAARENLGLGGTLRRNVPGRSSLKERSQTLPRNIGSNLQVHAHTDQDLMMLTASNSSSCESVNSQEGAKKSNRQEQLEMRHQELLKKQKALQEQYARLQQLQRGNNALTVVPPTPDILLKKTGSESNILQKMGLNMMSATPQINTGSLTHLANNNGNTQNNKESGATITNASTTSKVYETDIL